MKYRVPLCWHECPGFDGEGCTATMIVYDEDLARGWTPPGTTIRTRAGLGSPS
jgi:hypothetical protein